MDIEKLIELLSRYSEPVIAYKLDADFAAACMEAANELAKIPSLQAENEKLRKELEWKDMVIELAQRKEREARAELEQVKRMYEAEKEDFIDFACSGVPNLSLYCMSRHPSCVDERGWCRTEKCRGFSRERGQKED